MAQPPTRRDVDLQSNLARFFFFLWRNLGGSHPKISTRKFGDLTGERSCGCREAQAPKVSAMASGGGDVRGSDLPPRDFKTLDEQGETFCLFWWYIEMGRFYTKSIS